MTNETSYKVRKRLQKAFQYLQKGDLRKSEEQAKRSLKALHRLKSKPVDILLDIGGVLNNIGAQHSQAGNFKNATSLFQNSLKLKIEAVGKQHESSIGTLKNLAQSAIFSCNFNLAQKSIDEILTLSQENHDESLQKYAQTQGKILEDIQNNRPPLFGHIMIAGGRFMIPVLESIYLPKLFERLRATVENIQVEIRGYETLRCSVCFQVSTTDRNESIAIDTPYNGEEWKVEAPPSLRSRIAESSDNFIVFFDKNLNLRNDQLTLVDEKGKEIRFELRGGPWDVHTPFSYPRFGYVSEPSNKIPLCKQFTFFRGNGVAFRWKLDLGTTYKLQFTLDMTSFSNKIEVSTPRLGFLFPFRSVSVQRIILNTPLSEINTHSVIVKPIPYHKNRQGAGILPVKIDASELSLRSISKGRHQNLRKGSSNGAFMLNQPLNLDDFRIIGLQLSYFPQDNLTVWVKTWDQPIPTGIYHTLTSSKKFLVPIVNYRVVNNSNEEKRILLCTKIGDLTQEQRTTRTYPPKTVRNVVHLPPVQIETLQKIVETRVTNIHTKAVELDGSQRLILENSYPVRLLAYDTIIWEVKNPSTGVIEDFSEHIAAWVTPHTKNRVIEKIIRKAVDFHPQKVIMGYKGARTPNEQAEVIRSQVKAVYDALKEYGISYVDAPICFGTDTPELAQRIRLPQDSIKSRSANCIDGSVLFASVLEHIGINPVIVLIPGHAFMGWETWKNSGRYDYLETTMLATHTFEEALRTGHDKMRTTTNLPSLKRKILKINALRKDGILPMS